MTVPDIEFRSECPIARTLDLLGDKWTLLILRDALFFNTRTFAGFERRPEHIPTNLLSARLKRLVEAGLLEKVAYQEHPVRYEYRPTELCRAVRPVIRSMRQFGEAHLEGKVTMKPGKAGG